MKKLILITGLVLLVGVIALAGGQDEEAPDVPIEEGFSSTTAAGMDVQWMVDDDTITIRMSARTTGWVAVGFDPSQQMADANIIIGYVEDGEAVVSDDYGIGRIRHGRDTENGGTDDLISYRGEEREGVTVIEFTIPLDSGDPMDKPLVPGNTYKVIVAHGPDGADDLGTYHATRGSFEMEL